MKNIRRIGIVGGVLVVVAVLSLLSWQGAASTAFAQGGTPTPNQPAAMATAFWNALASKLGIGVDDLKAKAVAAQKDVIEQQVKDGTLTRAQADQMEQRLDANGVPFFGGPHDGFGRGGAFGLHDANTLDAVAKALNMTTADLQAQLQSGKSLAEIAKSQNVDEAKVKQAIIDAEKAEIQGKVQSGQITQAQADQKLARLTPEQIDLSRMPNHRGPLGGSQ